MWNRILQLIRKELIVTLRDPRMRIFLFLPPVVQLVIFGYAVNLDVPLTYLAWVDSDRSTSSRLLADEFEGSSFFTITHRTTSLEEAQGLVDRGLVSAVIQIPEDFEEQLLAGRTPALQLVLDGADSNSASVVSGYIGGILENFQRRLGAEQGYQAEPPIEVRSRVWFNPDLESRVYFVPGVIVNIVGLITIMLTAMAIVREKEIGTLEQLMVTPLRPLEVMLGKTLPFAAIGMVEMILVTTAALVVFEVPFRGDPLTLLGATLIFLWTSLGIGLLISTLSGTQQQAMMGSFFFFLPAFLLSGFAFPIRNMPEVIQWITFLDPMRYFVEIVRGVFLKGLGFEALQSQFLGLTILGIVVTVLSSLRFHKRLD